MYNNFCETTYTKKLYILLIKMPRESLPSHLKSIKTMEVQLTKTTEEDLWKHFLHRFSNIEDEYKFIHDRLDKAIEYLYNKNPYYRHNFRKNRCPDRIYGCMEWLNSNIESSDYEKFWNYYDLRSDLKRCNGEFKWIDDETKGGEYSSMMYVIDRLLDQTKEKQQELEELDKARLQEAKNHWLEDDKEWIEEQELIKSHRHHQPKEYYEEQIRKDPDAKAFYERKGGIPNYHETCKYCIADIELKKRQEEAIKRSEEERLEADRQWREEQERKREEERKERAKPLKVFKCEECNFKTNLQYSYEDHMDSREHKQKVKCKELYCECCKIQCRTLIEYNHHITTSKHRKNNGEVVEETLYCECCNHTSTTKQNYQTHLKSKKHQQKMQEVNVTIPTTEE